MRKKDDVSIEYRKIEVIVMARLWKSIIMVSAALLVLQGCGTNTLDEIEETVVVNVIEEVEEEKVIGLSVDQEFDSRIGVTDAIKATAEELGYEIIESIAEGDAQTQNMQILEFVEKEVDVILVCAVDQNLVEESLVVVEEAGIPIVAFDRDLPDSEFVECYIGPDSVKDGEMCAEALLENFAGQQGTIYVLELVGALNDQNGIDRSKGWNDAIAGHTNIRVIQMPTDWDVDSATEAIQSAFQAIPEIQAIYCSTDSFVPSVKEILSGLKIDVIVGEEGHIFVNGINGSEEGYEALINNEIDGIVVMDLETIGKESIYVVDMILNGEDVPEKILVPSTYYTNENAEENSEYIWGAQ